MYVGNSSTRILASDPVLDTNEYNFKAELAASLERAELRDRKLDLVGYAGMGAAPTLAQLEKHREKFMPPEVVGSGYEAKSRGRDARRRHNEAVDEVVDLYGLRPKGTFDDKVHALKADGCTPAQTAKRLKAPLPRVMGVLVGPRNASSPA